MRKIVLIFVCVALFCSSAALAAAEFRQIAEFDVPEANQGIGVDENHFYAVDNRTIAKYDKRTGKLVDKWEGEKDGPIIHLDRKICCAHSNWDEWPMASPIASRA